MTTAEWNNATAYKASKELVELFGKARTWAMSRSADKSPLMYVPTVYTVLGAKTHCITRIGAGRQYTSWCADNATPSIDYSFFDCGSSHLTESAPPLACYIELLPLANLVGESETVYELYCNVDGTIDSFGQLTPSKRRLIAYDNLYAVASINWYDNSENGNYDVFNPRPLLNNQDTYEVAFPISVSKYRRYNSNSNYFDGEAGGIIYIPMTQSIKPYNTGGSDGAQYPYLFYNEYITTPETAPPVLGKTLYIANKGTFTVFNGKEAVTALGKMFGCPIYTDLDDILYSNAPTDGVPDDPVNTGGDGSGDNTIDPMESNAPSFAPNQAAISYAMTANEVRSLYDWLLTDDFYTNISKFFNEPSEFVVGCQYYPFDLALHDGASLEQVAPIVVGNVSAPLSTTGREIFPFYNRALGEYSITVEPYYGNFLDFDPYTRYELYLPYIGYKAVNATTILNGTLTIKYFTDLSEGRVLAQIWINTTMLESYEGQLGISIPMSASDGRERAIKAISTVGSVAASAVTGGAASAATAAIGAVTQIAAASAANIDKGGAIMGDVATFNPQDIYLIITRPVAAVSRNYSAVKGYKATYGGLVSEFTGFLQCRDVKGGTGATDEENQQIIELLKGGVYI